MKTQRIAVGLLDYPGAQQAAIHGLIDLLTTANSFSGPPATAQFHAEKIPVETITTRLPIDRPLGYLIIPPCLDGPPDAAQMRGLLAGLVQLHATGTRLCSICAGAFVLAATGLLDERAATTHWALADDFRRVFPCVRLDTSKMLIDLGDVLTAGGVMAWLDLGLHLIGEGMGEQARLNTARMFLIDPAGREQSFFAQQSPKLAHGDAAIRAVQAAMQLCLQDAPNIPTWASQAHMGTRTFLRRFKMATGDTPLQYFQRLRVAAACKVLEHSRKPIAEVAWAVGYENESAFRKVFRRETGMTPGEYRRRWSSNN